MAITSFLHFLDRVMKVRVMYQLVPFVFEYQKVRMWVLCVSQVQRKARCLIARQGGKGVPKVKCQK